MPVSCSSLLLGWGPRGRPTAHCYPNGEGHLPFLPYLLSTLPAPPSEGPSGREYGGWNKTLGSSVATWGLPPASPPSPQTDPTPFSLLAAAVISQRTPLFSACLSPTLLPPPLPLLLLSPPTFRFWMGSLVQLTACLPLHPIPKS